MKYIIGYLVIFTILLVNSTLNISCTLTWLICYVVSFLFIRKGDPLSPEPWLFFSWNVLFINIFSGVRFVPQSVSFTIPILYVLCFLFCFHIGYKLNKCKSNVMDVEKMRNMASTVANPKMQRVFTYAGIISIIGVILVLIDIFFMLGLSMDGGDRRAGFIENFARLSWRTNIGMVMSGGIYISMFSMFWGGNKRNSFFAVLAFLASVLYSFAVGGKQGVLLSILVILFALLVRRKYKIKHKISLFAKVGALSVGFFMFTYITLLSSQRHEGAETGEMLNNKEIFSKEFIVESNKYLPNSVKNTFAEFFGYYCDQLGTFAERWELDDYPNKYGFINLISDPFSPFVFVDRQIRKLIHVYNDIYPEDEDLMKMIYKQNRGYYGLANWQTILQQGIKLYGLVGLLLVFFIHGYISKTLVVSTKKNCTYSKLGLCFVNCAFMVYTIMCNILGETSILIYLLFLLYCLKKERKERVSTKYGLLSKTNK